IRKGAPTCSCLADSSRETRLTRRLCRACLSKPQKETNTMNAIAFFIMIGGACGLAGCLVRRVVPGPDAHFTNSLIAAGVSAFICGKYGPGNGVGLAGGIACAAAVIGIVCCDWWLHRRRIRKSVQTAHAVREFGLTRFDILDDDGDGLVSAVD